MFGDHCHDQSAPYNCTGSRPGGCYLRQIDALEAERDELKSAYDAMCRRAPTASDIEDAIRAEVVALKAKLARYEADLTGPQQVAIVESINLPVVSTNTVRIFDAAIRKVRGQP
jgi:hypothetical protein